MSKRIEIYYTFETFEFLIREKRSWTVKSSNNQDFGDVGFGYK